MKASDIRKQLNEPTQQKTLMATTGCVLTDEIFGVAHRASIVPQEFFDKLELEG